MFLIDVTGVKVLDGRRLELHFADGLCKVIDLDDVVDRYDGVFAVLTDPAYFRLVRVDAELGTIVWPNGADVCPDVLYAIASGRPIRPPNLAAIGKFL